MDISTCILKTNNFSQIDVRNVINSNTNSQKYKYQLFSTSLAKYYKGLYLTLIFITHIDTVFTLNFMQKNISLVTFSIFFLKSFNANNIGSAYQNRKK